MRFSTAALLCLPFAPSTIFAGSRHHLCYPSDAESKCRAETFGSLPKGAEIETIQFVRESESFGEGAKNLPYPKNPTDLPELCALIVRVPSSPTSSYRFGLFLPTEWNDRSLSIGNGGFAGGINWLDMGNGVRYGFAITSTDTGHNSTSLDVKWAASNPEAREDFGHRAIHGSAVVSKALIKKYYGRRPDYAYYSGCSTGGRQGLKEVQLHADTFDGILVGAPAWWTSHSQLWGTKTGIYNLPVDSPGRLTTDSYPILAAEVVRQCDLVDGVKDGIVNLPDSCDFDINQLLCNGTANAGKCLSQAQIETANHIYSDYYADGKLVFPGNSYGSELQWPYVLGGTEPTALGIDYIRYFVLNDPSFQWQDYNDSLVAVSEALDVGNCTADDYDSMLTFAARGGKAIMYHGWADSLISTRGSVYFYEQVQKASAAATGNSDVSDWFRFFPVAGMGHCTMSSFGAAWHFAGANQAGELGTNIYSVPGFEDADHDALLALMKWVEEDKPVERIIATGWNNVSDISQGVSKQRPLCPYPEIPVWDGVGNTNLSDSWSCSCLEK